MKTKAKNASPVPPDRSFDVDAEAEEPLPGHTRIKLASVLDDYLDEEVVDNHGKPIGTLSCYWESADGQLIFCGVKLAEKDGVRVVPGGNAQLSERHSWVRVDHPGAMVHNAPRHDCDEELSGAFELKVYEHYGLVNISSQGGLKYISSSSGRK